jgi:hypothetical protein
MGESNRLYKHLMRGFVSRKAGSPIWLWHIGAPYLVAKGEADSRDAAKAACDDAARAYLAAKEGE